MAPKPAHRRRCSSRGLLIAARGTTTLQDNTHGSLHAMASGWGSATGAVENLDLLRDPASGMQPLPPWRYATGRCGYPLSLGGQGQLLTAVAAGSRSTMVTASVELSGTKQLERTAAELAPPARAFHKSLDEARGGGARRFGFGGGGGRSIPAPSKISRTICRITS
jgi:hypothetical protein